MKIAWIGTGVMGRSMAGHLLDAGHQVNLYSRTKQKAGPLIERGAQWHDSARNAGVGAEVVFTMVGYPEELREVVLGDTGVLRSMTSGSLLIDCTTSSPSLAVEIAKAAGVKGVLSLDAPVSGGDVGARNAALSIMVGGDQAAFDRAMPLLQKLGKTIVHQGPAGSGQHTKMVNQILIAAGMVALCEGLTYARAAGLDCERVMQSVSGGAAGSWSLTNYGPRILKGDFAPGFYVEHFIKDMKIAIDEATRMKLNLPGLAMARHLYEELADMGHAKAGTHSLVKVIEAMSSRSAS
jgi:3-hydroxyisobutyrate dehydrogenase